MITFFYRSTATSTAAPTTTISRSMGDPMDEDDTSSSESALDVRMIDSDAAMMNVNKRIDEEDEEESKFQKENHLLKNLPYYTELQIETEEYLEKIITNIAKTIICHDFQLGLVIYTKSLKT